MTNTVKTVLCNLTHFVCSLFSLQASTLRSRRSMCRISAWSCKYGIRRDRNASEQLLRHTTRAQWESYWCTIAPRSPPLTTYRTGWSRLRHMPAPMSRRCSSPTRLTYQTGWFPRSKASSSQTNMASNSLKHQRKMATILTKCSMKWQNRSFVIVQYKPRPIRGVLTDMPHIKHSRSPGSKRV